MPNGSEVDLAVHAQVTGVSADDLVPDRQLDADQEDRFRYEAIAGRLAELVCAVDPPTNIALYGAWGSGKSSVGWLLEQQLHRRATGPAHTQTAFVRYDAWQFGGHSLKRNFISHAASELDVDSRRYPQFRRGLYEDHRHVEISPGRLVRAVVRALPAVFAVFLLFNVLAAGILALWSLRPGGPDLWSQIRTTLPDVTRASGLIAFVVAAARGFLESGRIEIQQTKPSDDEEFTARFDDLVSIACRPRSKRWLGLGRRGGLGYDRIVFFVDELDRCAESDVVATLVAIRTFLDRPNCVFVVAADRRVLERALAHRPQQPVPVDGESPYYTGASAYLDKIFAHQIDLPPLRGRRLSRFARDLVTSQSGIWEELRASRTDPLDYVLFVLVPSHVRSPRRVKVLLNRFATNYRVAESRGIALEGRAAEVAKLTVLQTEFPLVAADLHIEPSLTEWLIDDENGPPHHTRVFKLWQKHTSSGPDEYLTSSTDSELAERHREQLRRYLEVTRDVRGPDRSLIFLEAAGEAFDLEDAELGDLIEDLAPDRPSDLVERMAERTEPEKIGAIRLLADMCQDVIGPARANTLHVLLAIAWSLDVALSEPALNEAVSALRLVLGETTEGLAADDVVPAISLASLARDATVGELLDDPRVWAEDERVVALLSLVDRFAAAQHAAMNDRLEATLAERPSLFGDLCSRLDTGALQVLAGLAAFQEQAVAVASADLSEPTPVELLFAEAAARTSPTLAEIGLDLLERLDDDEQSRLLRAVDTDALRIAPSQDRVRDLTLGAWSRASAASWEEWSNRYSTIQLDGRAEGASDVVRSILEQLPNVDSSAYQGVSKYLRQLIPHVEGGATSEFESAVSAALEPTAQWIASDESAETREGRYAVLGVLTDLGFAAEAVDQAIAGDLAASVEAACVPESSVTASGSVVPMRPNLARTLRLVTQYSPALPQSERSGIFAALRSLDPPPEPRIAATVATTQIRLAADAPDSQQQEFLQHLTAAVIAPAVRSTSQAAGLAVAAWIHLDPSPTEIRQVIWHYGNRVPVPVRAASSQWGERLTKAARTSLLSDLLRRDAVMAKWIGLLAETGPVDYPKLVRASDSRIRGLSRGDKRLYAATNLAALQAEGPTAQALIAELICWLAARPHAIDTSVAIELLPGRPRGGPGQRKLETAIPSAIRRHEIKLTEQQATLIRQAGIEVPTESLGQRLKKLFVRGNPGTSGDAD